MGTNNPAAVTVIGSINTDLVAGVGNLPKRGETIHARNFEQHLGGKGANQAVATALLGAEVALVGCVGDDGAGARALQGLDEAGVNRERVRIAEGVPTGTALITVDDGGDNTIVVVPGANDELTPADVHAVQSKLAGSAAVVLQMEVPDAVVSAAAEAVSAIRQSSSGDRSGVGKPSFVFNPSPFRTSALPPAGSIDLLLVNELEAEAMSGVKVRNPADAVGAARKLLAQLRSGGCVVITLGVQGAIALADPAGPFAPATGSPANGREETEMAADVRLLRAQPLYVPALKVDAIDTTGAGDVFTGGLVSQLWSGESLADSLRFATAAAAVTVTRAGAQSSFPRPDEVERMLPGVKGVQALSG